MEDTWINDAKQKKHNWEHLPNNTHVCGCMCAYVYIVLKTTEWTTQKLNKQTKKIKQTELEGRPEN